MTTDIQVTTTGAVQVLRMARPAKKNALTEAMYGGLADALERGDQDDAIAAHVITGSEGVFSAGNDLKDFLAAAAASGTMGRNILRFVHTVPQLTKPLIAAVDGPSVGIGTTLLFHCDLVYATPEARFSTPFADLGLVPEFASSLLMPQRLGHARAFEMLALGATLTSERLREAGLVNAVVAAAELEGMALKAAEALAKKPQEALALTRRLMRADPAAIVQRIDEEAEEFRRRLASREARAAFEAFLSRGRG